MHYDPPQRMLARLPPAPRRRFLVLVILLVVGFAGCRTATPAGPVPPAAAPALPLIVLSLDGWRWDYYTKAKLPALQRLVEGGVRSEGLIPAFPSKTFPNHYTIVTGLYPGHHGVVGNSMVDPAIPGRFTLSDREQVGNSAWWGGEPLWVTAIRQGRLAAALFWPGSEAAIGGVRPTEWALYDGSLPNEARIDRLLGWLDRPADRRPALLLTYFSDADEAGHTFGPDSPELLAALGRIDRALAHLLAGLEARGLADRVNIVLVSDHGMAATSRDRVIVLGDYLDLASVDVVDANPNLAIAPKTLTADEIYRKLHGAHPHLRVYRKADSPPDWRFRAHARVPAIVGMADEGWSVLRRPPASTDRFSLGNHGYDPAVASMRGLFVASGPAFRRGIVVPPFESVDVYSVLARALGVTPAPNDGDPGTAARILR
jgi:predicted AlkP superfamily pyrophosphatase or phosphodiesterase